MKNIVAIALTLFASGSPVVAQEANWDRWFVGFDAGYVWRSHTTIADGKTEMEGASAGVSAGRWWVFDQVAIGAEGAVSFGGPTYRRTDDPSPLTMNYDHLVYDTISIGAKIKAGIPAGRFMTYLAAGPQYIHSGYSLETLNTGEKVTGRRTDLGVTLAAGVEFLVTDNIALKAEAGLNLKFDDSSLVTNYSGWSIKAGVNYYFD